MKDKISRSQKITYKIVRGFDELADSLSRDEKVQGKFTVRRMVLNHHPVPYSPSTVKQTRQLLRMSQAVFAQFLGIKVSTLRSWEQGRNSPPDMACRFMDEIQRNPDYWKERMQEAIQVKV